MGERRRHTVFDRRFIAPGRAEARRPESCDCGAVARSTAQDEARTFGSPWRGVARSNPGDPVYPGRGVVMTAFRRSAPTSLRLVPALAACLLLPIPTRPVHAQQPTSAPPPAMSPQQLTKEALNPFGDVVKIPIEAVAGFRSGPRRETGAAMSLEPVIPLSLGPDWDVIVQPLLQAEYAPAPDATLGLADAQTSIFVTPARTGAWIWGLGPIFEFPTATDSRLGTGKWSAGPTGAVIYSQGPWLNGVLASHLASFAGQHARPSVGLTTIEPQLSYTLASGWYVQCNPTITYDWTADAWLVPLGLDVGKTFNIGSQALSLQIGAYDLLERPSGDPAAILRTQLTFLFPTSD